ncbi:MAG TPA: hypothetical protein VIW27_02470 [Gammaproteobacteria bacterium]
MPEIDPAGAAATVRFTACNALFMASLPGSRRGRHQPGIAIIFARYDLPGAHQSQRHPGMTIAE